MSIRRDAGGSDSGIRTVPDPASQVLKIPFMPPCHLPHATIITFREGENDLALELPWEGSAGQTKLPRWPR